MDLVMMARGLMGHADLESSSKFSSNVIQTNLDMGFPFVWRSSWKIHEYNSIDFNFPYTSLFTLFDENESLRICEIVVDIVPRVRIIWIPVKIVGLVMNVHMT
jgi:hypothetical protein